MFEGMCIFWFAIFLIILLCELFVLYKAQIFYALAAGAFGAFAISEFCDSIFVQDVAFLAISVLAYFTFWLYKRLKVKNKAAHRMTTAITYQQIKPNDYGKAFCDGKCIVIKNTYSKPLKRGEVIELKTQEEANEQSM